MLYPSVPFSEDVTVWAEEEKATSGGQTSKHQLSSTHTYLWRPHCLVETETHFCVYSMQYMQVRC